MRTESFSVEHFLFDLDVSVNFLFTRFKYFCSRCEVYLFLVSTFYKINVFLTLIPQ
jgi:hypothetical protein